MTWVNSGERYSLLKIVTSNRDVERKNLMIKLSLPFSEIANRFAESNDSPERDIPGTWDKLIVRLSDILVKQPDVPVIFGREGLDSHDFSIAA